MTPTNASEPQYLRLSTCARYLGISKPHLSKLIREGEAPPSVMLGRARLFSVDTLKTWMREREK